MCERGLIEAVLNTITANLYTGPLCYTVNLSTETVEAIVTAIFKLHFRGTIALWLTFRPVQQRIRR